MYSRLSDLYNQYGEDAVNQIAESDRTGTPDPLLVKRAITNADTEINAALAGRYKIPFAPTPGLIRRISSDLAWWFLHGLKVPEIVDDRAKLARELLKMLASGEMLLEGAESKTQSFARIETGREKMRWSGKDRR
jgi:phage gp36-like protein